MLKTPQKAVACNTDMEVFNRLSELRKSKDLVDITFKVGDSQVEFQAHKLILAMVSEVFRAMTYGPMATEDVIVIPDVEPEAFAILLNYVYKDEANFHNVREALSCMYAARKYLMLKLVKRCTQYLNENKNEQNVCDIYRLAVMLDQTDLAKKCEDFVSLNLPAVLGSPGFLNLDEDIVLKVTDKMSLKIDPVVLFVSLLKWALFKTTGSTECEEHQDMTPVRDRMMPFLPFILFLAMTPKRFYSVVSVTGILTYQEIVAITMAMLEVDGEPLPPWCNAVRKVTSSGRIVRGKAAALKRTVPYKTRKSSRS